MDNLKMSITTESLELLSEYSGIIEKRESLKAEIKSYIKVLGSEKSTKIIGTGTFKDVPNSTEITSTINGKIQEVNSIKIAQEEISTQTAENMKKIAALKQSSKNFVGLIIFVVISAIVYFIFFS